MDLDWWTAWVVSKPWEKLLPLTVEMVFTAKVKVKTPILLLRSRGSLKGEVWTQFSSTKLIFPSSLPPQKRHKKTHHIPVLNKVQEKNKRHQPFLVGIDSNEFHPALHGMDRSTCCRNCHGGVKTFT